MTLVFLRGAGGWGVGCVFNAVVEIALDFGVLGFIRLLAPLFFAA